MSVSKSWRFKERLTTQFRAEFFNITNHPNFANPFGGTTGQGRAPAATHRASATDSDSDSHVNCLCPEHLRCE